MSDHDALHEVYGAALLGVIVNAWLVGIICIMSYQYYNNFPGDRPASKLLVAWILFLQIFNAFDVAFMVYHYLISSFGIGANLGVGIWAWNLYLGIEAITAVSVQVFYAWRVFILTKSYLLSAIIVILALLGVGFGLATMSEAFRLVDFSRFTSVTWVCATWLGASATCDIVITVVQIIYLHRQRTGISGTNRIINTLILYILSTGLLTGVIAIIELTTFVTLGFNFSHIFLSQPLGAVYTVSFLANLDARRILREIGPETVPHGLSELGSMKFLPGKLPRDNTTSTSSTTLERGTCDLHIIETKIGQEDHVYA